MFLPPKLATIVVNSLAVVFVFAGSTAAQQAELDRRIAAMQEARARAQQPPAVRVASNDVGIDYSAPPSPQGSARTARATNTASAGIVGPMPRYASMGQSGKVATSRVAAASARVAHRFVPEHTRTAQLVESPMIDSYSPVVESAPMGYASCGDGSCGGEVYQSDIIVDGGCSSCGDCGCCGDCSCCFRDCGACCGRGGCPPGPCLLSGLGAAFRNAEFFAGAAAFGGPALEEPAPNYGQLWQTGSYGFYQGINLGVPLCHLTGGWLSGQIGFRAVQSNFHGNEFNVSDRNQIFFTTGLYRRVDYGMQYGLVVDVLRDDWFTDQDSVQIRGDIGWVYPCGPTIGFRFATNAEDDVEPGEIYNDYYWDVRTITLDHYRFYYRCERQCGGYAEAFAGWSNYNQGVLGLHFDLPLRERLAAQAGFTYYLNGNRAEDYTSWYGGNPTEAYNVFVGLVFRPRGLCHYRSYDRPLFNVADNGSMVLKRRVRDLR